MPYLQAATPNIFGLMPDNGPQGRTNLYAVSASETVAILPGDAIVFTSSGTVRAALTADTNAAYRLVGAAAAPLSTGDFSATTFNLLVYDDPQQVYAIAVTTSLGMSVNFMNGAFNLITSSTAPGVVSTLSGRSKHAMGAVTSSGNYLRMLGLHPVEALGPSGYVITTSIGKPQKYLVVANLDVSQIPLTT